MVAFFLLSDGVVFPNTTVSLKSPNQFVMNPGPQQNQLPQAPQEQTSIVVVVPPSGGGAKPWIIMAILVVLVGLGLWAISAMGGKDDEANNEIQKEKAEKPEKKRAIPRVEEKTTPRPSKSEMANLSSKNPGAYERNVGKWVILKGEVGIGDKDGVVVFKEPNKMRGQLVKGSAEHLSGKLVKIIGWMVSKEKIQIEGIYDIEFIDPLDLLPKKDVYTMADAEQLVALRNSKAAFQGKVTEVRVSTDKKKRYVIFEAVDGYQFYGSGEIEKLDENDVTMEKLEKLVGKTVKIEGWLQYKNIGKAERVSIMFTKEESYEVVE